MPDQWWDELPDKVNVAVCPFTHAGTMAAEAVLRAVIGHELRNNGGVA